MSEVWKDVPGIPGYMVSDAGNIRSLPRKVLGKHGKYVTVPGKDFIQTRHKGAKYAMFYANGTNNYVHHAVLEAFVGPRPENAEACHGNGDHKDNRLENLRWDTQSENMYDRVRHGTHHQTIKVSCPRGHGFETWNLVARKQAQGYRECLACSKEYFSARFKGRPFDKAKADAIYVKLREGSK